MILFVSGGVDPDQKLIDIRMKAIKHKILVLSGKGGKTFFYPYHALQVPASLIWPILFKDTVRGLRFMRGVHLLCMLYQK